MAVVASGCVWAQSEARIQDLKHYSSVFGEERNFRIFLPPEYEADPQARYPVVYFFHGWSERHNRPPRGNPGYDSGEDYGGDTIARFVGSHKLIVVKWDGYNPRTPGEDYPRPYNISPVETYRQFPLYFPELVAYIDSHFRTIADRDHRATAGLSMGGFMSFWVAGKYPHLVGSASNFMGSSEFYAGPNGFPSEYRHSEMYGNYEGVRTRLVTGSRDFIRWYHRRMNAVWDVARPHYEREEFNSAHGTPGMAKTLEFHMKAFADPLPRPAVWHHADVYPAFDVWGYSVATDRHTPGFTVLERVSRAGFRSSVREWLPRGRLLPSVSVRISTDALYTPNHKYHVTDVNASTDEVKQTVATADAGGRLHLEINGDAHEIGISEAAMPVVTISDFRVASGPWATNGAVARLKLKLLNKGAAVSAAGFGTLISSAPGVQVRTSRFTIPTLRPGSGAESAEIAVQLDGAEREFAHLVARVNGLEYPVDFPVYPKLEETDGVVVLDGAKARVWQRAVRQVDAAYGAGNGDGEAQLGEQVVLGVRDGAAVRMVEVLTPHRCVDLTQRVSDAWGGYDNVGATAKYTVLQVSASCAGTTIPLVVEYQLPSKPEHVLKRGLVSLRVSGQDKTAPQVESAGLSGWNRIEMRVHEGGRVRDVTATLTSGNTKVAAALNDDGRNGDVAAGDGLFAGMVNPPAGDYRLTVELADEDGNGATQVLPDPLTFTLPPPSSAAVR